MSGFCQFKTAYLLGTEFENLSESICEESIFNIVENEKLPEGWELTETGISGAAGFILVFDAEGIPTQENLNDIERYLKELETRFNQE